MSYRIKAIAAAVLSLATLALAGFASAADLPYKAKAKPVADLPFFFVIDDRVTYSYIFNAAQPGMYTVRPDLTFRSSRAKQWKPLVVGCSFHPRIGRLSFEKITKLILQKSVTGEISSGLKIIATVEKAPAQLTVARHSCKVLCGVAFVDAQY